MKVICDKCENYVVAMSGTTAICKAKYHGSRFIVSMDKIYIEKRMTGEVDHCKGFKKLN